jgi:HK97 gp10 family phage protein
MPAGFRFRLDPRAVADLVYGDDMDDMLQEVGDQVAETAQSLAPKASGEGAASIHAEVHRGEDSGAFPSTYTPPDDVPTAYVSWDQEHFYMLFAEIGTEFQPARPFLRPALDA